MAIQTVPALINGKTLEQHLLILQNCIASKGTTLLNKISGGVQCSDLELTKLLMIYELLSKTDSNGRGLECIFTLEPIPNYLHQLSTYSLIMYGPSNTYEYDGVLAGTYNNRPWYGFTYDVNNQAVVFWNNVDQKWEMWSSSTFDESNITFPEDPTEYAVDFLGESDVIWADSRDGNNSAPIEADDLGWKSNNSNGLIVSCNYCTEALTPTGYLEKFINYFSRACKDCIVTEEPAVTPPTEDYYLTSESGVIITLENGSNIII